MAIEQKQLTLGISGVPPVSIYSPFVKAAAASSPAVADGINGLEPDDISVASTQAGPAPSGPAPMGKLSEGWHSTEKYGEVFVSPGGIAWAVQLVGDKFENVSVKLSANDIIGNNRAFKKKDALRKQAERARTRVSRTTPPLQPLQQVSASTEGVSEASL